MSSTGSLNGRAVLITGATNGIGLEAARELATRGAQVCIVGRNPEKTARVAREVNARHTILADLSELAQVQRAAQDYAQQVGRLDILINNAGVSLQTRQETREGIETVWATNHLAPFLLTTQLLPLLRASSVPRVVVVSSATHAAGRLRFDDPELKRGYDTSGWGGFKAYAQSKLANLLFTRELARREPGLQVNALHPGVVKTGIMGGSQGLVRPIQRVLDRFSLTPAQGARTIIHLAAEPVFGSGRYFVQGHETRPAPQALDDGAALRLWHLSQEYVAPFIGEPA